MNRFLCFWSTALACLLVLSACSKKEVSAPSAAPASGTATSAVTSAAGDEASPAESSSPEQRVDYVVMVDTNEHVIREQRFAGSDVIDVHYGPSRAYRIIEDIDFQKGHPIYVLEESGLWVRVRKQAAPGPSVGWINRFSTIPVSDGDLSAREREVAALLQEGIVLNIRTGNNEVVVSTNLWNVESDVIQSGMSRSLAYFCGLKKGSGNSWVEIRDSNSDKAVARFSANRGFRSYIENRVTR